MNPLPPADFEAWLARARGRMTALRAPNRADAAEIVTGLIGRLLPDGLVSADQHVLAGEEGEVWFATGPDCVVLDLAGDPRVLLPVVHEAARVEGMRQMKILVFPSQPDLAAATADLGYRPAATRMWLALPADPPIEQSSEQPIALEPLSPAAATDFVEQLVSSYAADLLSSGSAADPEAARASARQTTDQALAEPGSVVFAGIAAGQRIGILWLDVDDEETFVLDIVVEPEHRGRGFGRGLMLATEDYARSRGCRSVALSVFGDNAVARRLYDSLGYQASESFLTVEL